MCTFENWWNFIIPVIFWNSFYEAMPFHTYSIAWFPFLYSGLFHTWQDGLGNCTALKVTISSRIVNLAFLAICVNKYAYWHM